MQTFSKLLALAATASAAIISIDVGEDGLVFSPESTTAAVGDTLQFHFYAGSGPHSVVKADFASPCKPDTGAFFSGLMAGSEDGSSVYEVAVTSTDPIWFYCSAQRHCQNGMVGVVNPPSGQTISDFAAAAKGVAAASAPASPTGGTSTSVSPSSSTAESSSTSGSSSAASATSSATSAAASASSSATSAAKSASSVASSVASSASAAATSAKPAAAGRNDGKTAAALAVVAGGLVALMA